MCPTMYFHYLSWVHNYHGMSYDPGFFEIGGYAGLEEKFLGPQAWPNFTKDYVTRTELGLNVTAAQEKYAKCG